MLSIPYNIGHKTDIIFNLNSEDYYATPKVEGDLRLLITPDLQPVTNLNNREFSIFFNAASDFLRPMKSKAQAFDIIIEINRRFYWETTANMVIWVVDAVSDADFKTRQTMCREFCANSSYVHTLYWKPYQATDLNEAYANGFQGLWAKRLNSAYYNGRSNHANPHFVELSSINKTIVTITGSIITNEGAIEDIAWPAREFISNQELRLNHRVYNRRVFPDWEQPMIGRNVRAWYPIPYMEDPIPIVFFDGFIALMNFKNLLKSKVYYE